MGNLLQSKTDEELQAMYESMYEKIELYLNHIDNTRIDAVINAHNMHGYKQSDTKLSYELDFEFLTQMAERMSKNKNKYEPYNWKKHIDVEELKQALFRHVISVMLGKYEDDGRMFGHLEAIAINAMFINYQLKNKNV